MLIQPCNLFLQKSVSKGQYAPQNNMVNYTSSPIIVSYMIGPTTSDQLCSQSITILKMHEDVKVLQNLLYQNGTIIRSTTHHPTKYESYQTNDHSGVAFTKLRKTHE